MTTNTVCTTQHASRISAKPPRGTHRVSRVTYRPGTSLLHRLHPLVKLAWLIGGTVAVFALKQPEAVLGIALLAGLAFPLNGLALRKVHGLRLFAFTGLTLFLVQVLFTRDGTTVLRIGPLNVTWDGIAAGIYVAGRLLSVILLSYLFVLTTEPNDLAYTLMRIGLPYRYGFMLITALRLVPLFEEEAHIVYQAQLVRGIAYDRGGPRRFLTLARQFFLPLLVSAMSKVDALAVSMEGRCFGKYPRRTFLREVRFTWQDGVAVGVLVVLALVCFISSYAVSSF